MIPWVWYCTLTFLLNKRDKCNERLSWKNCEIGQQIIHMAQGNCRNSKIHYRKHLSVGNALCASPKIPNTLCRSDKQTKKYKEFNLIFTISMWLKIEKIHNGTKTIWKLYFLEKQMLSDFFNLFKGGAMYLHNFSCHSHSYRINVAESTMTI